MDIKIINGLMDRIQLFRVRYLVGVSIGHGSRFRGQPLISRIAGSRISIGKRVSLISRCSDTALGVAHPVVLRTLSAGAILTIGDDTGISGGSFCAALSVTIGSSCLIGADVLITDTDFHALPAADRRYENRTDHIACKAVVIGDNVFIGSRTIILKGVTIGRDSVIGAGSVVTKDIPPGVVAAGNPCRTIHELPIDRP